MRMTSDCYTHCVRKASDCCKKFIRKHPLQNVSEVIIWIIRDEIFEKIFLRYAGMAL
jgi:hypothetical protein